MLMNMQDESGKCRAMPEKGRGIVSSCPPPKVAGLLCSKECQKRRYLFHIQDEKQQKAEQSQREAGASSSAASDPLLATRTAVNSKERKRALQKES